LAIEIKYNSEFNYLFPNAYTKIENVRIDVMREELRIDIRIYADQKARNTDNSLGIGKKTFSVKFSELNNSNITKNDILKLCYEKIKENELLKDGKDV
jgi:hypothetical protein